MLKLTIDDREISVPEGTTVIQAAEQLGIWVPRYCYHPGLSIAGNCRICLVEVEKFPKLQIACNTPVMEGMVVHTKSESVLDGRRSVLEFLLANHPLDCPVCDQSGECDLQNFYMNFGLYDPRFREHKNKKEKAVRLGPHVMLDQERCILCSRCVRFTDEITETGEFGIFNRGDRAQVGLYPGDELENPYSANVVDICPVGALTESNSRFKARVWYLSGAKSLCNGCSQGCNIDLHYVLDRPHLNDGKRLVRVKPRINPDVNQWWLCDEGRYGLDWLDEGRLSAVRGPADETSWDVALDAISAALAQASRPGQDDARIGVIASAQLTSEELFLIQRLFHDGLGAHVTVKVPTEPGWSDDFLVKADKTPNSRAARELSMLGPEAPQASKLIEAALDGELDVLWVFGHDLAEELGEEELRKLSESVELLVFSGTNDNGSVAHAHWVLPSAAYVEKDGTFVNEHGRVQRIGKAFAPLADSREDWRFLLQLAERLGQEPGWRDPEQLFLALAEAEPAFAGLSYTSIGDQGAQLAGSDASQEALES